MMSYFMNQDVSNCFGELLMPVRGIFYVPSKKSDSIGLNRIHSVRGPSFAYRNPFIQTEKTRALSHGDLLPGCRRRFVLNNDNDVFKFLPKRRRQCFERDPDEFLKFIG